MTVSPGQLSLPLFEPDERIEKRTRPSATRPRSRPAVASSRSETPPADPAPSAQRTPDSTPGLLTTYEAADLLHVHPRTVQRLVEPGELGAVRLGSAVRFDPLDLTALTERLKRSAPTRAVPPNAAVRRGRAASRSFADRLRSQRMSIERRRRSDGRTVYVVRWYESGRGSARRKRSFDRRGDAELFEASLRRARQLGQLASEVIGSNATLEEFLVEWWDTYAVTHLRPSTLETYTTLLDRWIVPYLGRKRLREITRQTIDSYTARLRVDGAGAPTINRTLGVLQGVFHRAVEWRRLAWNPVVGVRRVAHSRAETIDARTPETVEAIRARLDPQNAALVSVLAYEGLRPAEAYALLWGDVIDDRGRPRKRLRVERAISGNEVTTTKSQRGREPELFTPVARELVELYLARGRPDRAALVFPDSQDGHLRRQNWRRRVWIPALERAGIPYFRSYDLRHHLRDAAPLRGADAERGRRAPRPRRPRLHRAHLRARDARRPPPAPRPDRAGDPDGTRRRRA